MGLLTGEQVEPVEVVKPADLLLEECYRLSQACLEADEYNEANVHLLSALGRFESPLVVVDISSDYEGYSWVRLPTVERIDVTIGQELTRQYMGCESLVAVESLQITAHTSDGKIFASAVPMAVHEPPQEKGTPCWPVVEVLVTTQARLTLPPTDIWYHLGGYSEDGDTYETQLYDFEEQLNLFWATVVGPGEYLRSRLFDCLRSFPIDWQSISIESNGKVWVSHKDGSTEMLQPPEISAS